MEDLAECPLCKFIRDSLHETPCCQSLFCLSCLSSRGRCPNCTKVFDIKECRVFKPLMKMVGQVLFTCKHPGCGQRFAQLLLAEHESQCRFNAGGSNELLQAFTDANSTPAGQWAQRRANIFAAFSSFANVGRLMANERVNESHKQLKQPQTSGEPVMHMVMSTDTIQGLALKYGTTAEEIKRVNKLRSDDIITRAWLMIAANRMPDLAAEMDLEAMEKMLARKLINRLRQSFGGLSEEEAEYYLELTNFDFEAARKECQSDLDWAKLNPQPNQHHKDAAGRVEHWKTKGRNKQRGCMCLFD